MAFPHSLSLTQSSPLLKSGQLSDTVTSLKRHTEGRKVVGLSPVFVTNRKKPCFFRVLCGHAFQTCRGVASCR